MSRPPSDFGTLKYMQICEKCVTLRDVLIEKLSAYATFLLAVNDHTRMGNLKSARDAQVSATRAGEEIGKARAELDDHAESHG
jgi:hypothetical protein